MTGFDFILAVSTLVAGVTGYPFIRAWMSTHLYRFQLESEAEKARLEGERKIRLAKQQAALDILPEQQRREEDLRILEHRRDIAEREARALIAEGNLTILANKVKFAVETGATDLTALPSGARVDRDGFALTPDDITTYTEDYIVYAKSHKIPSSAMRSGTIAYQQQTGKSALKQVKQPRQERQYIPRPGDIEAE